MKVFRVLMVFAIGSLPTMGFSSEDYGDTVAQWSSYQDVANWLQNHFAFDQERQKKIQHRLKSQGPAGLLVKAPDKLFADSKGYCGDSANFALQALNEIDFDYNPRWVFIKNAVGRPNHWVTAFDYEGKLYIMDYGTGDKWNAMQGVHGPYDSLSQYQDFLEGLSMPGFGVAEVRYRNMPGEED